MTRKTIHFILGLGLSVLSLACDHVCNHTVEDVASIQNMTGRSLTLTFCKGQVYGLAQITLPQDSLATETSLGSRQEKVARGGPTNSSCRDVSDEKRTMGITLAPNSFGKVKLCYDSANSKNVIVETYQTCPTGFLEQTSSETCRDTSS